MLYLLCIAATSAPGMDLPPGMDEQLLYMDQPPPGMEGPSLRESTLLKFARNSSCSSGTCTYDCAIDNHRAQVAAAPGYYYAQANRGLSESNSKQPLPATWEPLLEAVPGCNGLGPGELLEVSYLVVLDASWVAYWTLHAADFAAQGYPTLEASPRLMFDRVSYLFETQAPRAARTLPPLHTASRRTRTRTQTRTPTLALTPTLTPTLTRCDNSNEFTQLTEAIKQVVPPPLSHGHAEEAAPRKKSLFSRKSGNGH